MITGWLSGNVQPLYTLSKSSFKRNSRTNQEDIRYVATLNYTRISAYLDEPLTRTLASKTITADQIFDEIESNGVVYWIFKTQVSIYIYMALILFTIFFTVSRAMFFYKLAMKASKNIHKKMFHCLLEAPMRFFDTNPSGRVLNRFSKDMGAIDEILPRVLMDAITVSLVF